MAAGLSADLDRWEFDELMVRVGGRFARVEPRRRVAGFVRGRLAGLPRVNCWQVAGPAGDGHPRGMQRLLSAAVWDDAGMRDDLRGYVLEHFADPGAALVVDETGDLKRGTAHRGHPAAVHRRRRADRERPGCGVPGLCRRGRVRVHRPGAVLAPVLDRRSADPAVTEGGGPHWLLIRRSISDGEYAFYRAHAPGPVPLAQLVKVARSRWKAEDGFAGGKELTALDEHQVRST
jgi:SRSO17 transposase